MQDLFNAAPLPPAQARLAYPLVRMFDPSVSLEAWLAHARRIARRKPEHGGMIAVRDSREILHAVFTYSVDRDFRRGACLRVTDLIVGRLPGALVNGAVLGAAHDLAGELGCRTILIDVPTLPESTLPLDVAFEGMPPRDYAPAAVIFQRHAG
jgi:hypothetical protein